MLIPKRVKYRKSQRGNNRGIAIRGSKISFGNFGLKALENGLVKANHIESARVIVARKLRGSGKFYINIFPHKPVTKKPAETRMGKGKGDLSHWVAAVKRGRVLFELAGIPEGYAKEIFRLVAFKLPVRTKFLVRGS